jgi:hypothetical protein
MYSLVIPSVPDARTVFGVPATPIRQTNRWIAAKLAAAAAREARRRRHRSWPPTS